MVRCSVPYIWLLIWFTGNILESKPKNIAVTYELSPGRFGDNLLSYIHAKWVSYTYNIQLLYKPFIHSDELVLHQKEKHLTSKKLKKFKKTKWLSKTVPIDVTENSVLYVVPYFPESHYERMYGISFSGGPWYYFDVNWQDKTFIEQLKALIAPINPVETIKIPDDRISVAIHIRKGGNYDDELTKTYFPLKFLPIEFYVDQLKDVYIKLNKPLYVYIFTDDTGPLEIVQKFNESCFGFPIEFDCRKELNSDILHVVEDFFKLIQFDCLLHSESNYSFIASKLKDYFISLFPDRFHIEKNKIFFDHINYSYNKDYVKNGCIKLSCE